MNQVLLITNKMANDAQDNVLQEFTSALNKQSTTTKYDFCTMQDLVFRVLPAGGVSVTKRGAELSDTYDFVHLRNMQKFSDYANALRLYAEKTALRLVNPADATMPYHGKVSQGFLFALNDVPTPPFISSASNEVLKEAIFATSFDYPLVIKHNEGIKGMDNYLVADQSEMNEVLSKDKQHFLAQPFVANEGEFRVLTFGGLSDPLIFKKRAQAGEYRNNTSQGGSAELTAVDTVDTQLLQDAMMAAQLTGRDIGGVDVLLAKDDSWYILEVNSTPQIATGAYTNEKLARYDAYFNQRGL